MQRNIIILETTGTTCTFLEKKKEVKNEEEIGETKRRAPLQGMWKTLEKELKQIN